MSDPQDILEQLDHIRAQTLQRFEGLDQAQLDWRPTTGEGEAAWSLGEVFLHLALDEHYLREHIARPLLESVPPPESIHFVPPPPAYGAQQAAIRFWFERARELTRRLLLNLPAEANLELKHEGGIEPMNGLEWLAAYGGHEAFHHRQLDELIEKVARQPSPAAPAA